MATESEILELISASVIDVLPETAAHTFSPSDSLVDLGANSVDRAEILNLVLENLSLNMPRTQLFGPQNIGELAALLCKALNNA